MNALNDGSEPTAAPARRSRSIGRGLVRSSGWLLSLALLWGMIRSVPLERVGEAIGHLEPLFGLAAVAMVGVNLWLRGGRWSLLLAARHSVPPHEAAAVAVLGLAVNAVLPGRAGEVVRIGVASRRFGSGVVFTAATIVTERLFDGLTLLGFLGLSLATLSVPDGAAGTPIGEQAIAGTDLETLVYSLATASLLLAGLAALLSLSRFRQTLGHLGTRMPGRIGGLIGSRVEALLAGLGDGFAALKQPRTAVGLGAYSVLIWLALTAANWLVAQGLTEIHLSVREALVFTAMSIAASSIPSAPGAWGVFEAGGLLALRILGVESTPAVAVAFVLSAHLSQYLPSVALGALLGLRWRASRQV